MEPLGAAGSILTITEALITLGRIIKSLQKVPVELVALDNELVDLKSLFLQIEVLRAEQPEALSSLSSTLSKANGHVQDIKDLADEYNGRLLTGFDRIKWVAEKSKISKLKQELREQRNRLDTLLIANTL